MRFVLATANPDKVVELRAIMGGYVDLLPRPDHVADVDETADSLEGNARLKAIALVEATGLAAIADDTGLEVDALGGAPGVHSARFAGAGANYSENLAALLDALAGELDRRARFRSVALARFPDGSELVAQGVVEGEIAGAPRGSGGFGYDPVFVPSGHLVTFAEMSLEAKNAISHRGRAFRELAACIGRTVDQRGRAGRVE